eukprot:1156900-Pelagomonas_calceolata.AAC.7
MKEQSMQLACMRRTQCDTHQCAQTCFECRIANAYINIHARLCVCGVALVLTYASEKRTKA